MRDDRQGKRRNAALLHERAKIRWDDIRQKQGGRRKEERAFRASGIHLFPERRGQRHHPQRQRNPEGRQRCDTEEEGALPSSREVEPGNPAGVDQGGIGEKEVRRFLRQPSLLFPCQERARKDRDLRMPYLGRHFLPTRMPS